MSAESGVLLVKASGRFSLAEAKRTFIEMFEEVLRSKVDKVLFDGRELTGEPAVIERFYYSEFAARAVVEGILSGAFAAPKFAYVLVEPVLDPRRFGETVAVNRGMHVKSFDNLDTARLWLLGNHWE